MAEPNDELQFDRVTPTSPDAGPASHPERAVVCASCSRPIATEYYDVHGKPVCASCKQILEAHQATGISGANVAQATVFGIGAAIAGAAIYYAITATLGWELSLITILIGYMVGYSVRKGAGGRGGRPFQIIAVALTYFAVGLAYVGLATRFSSFSVASIVLALTLPLRVVLDSMPNGILSGIIIGVGLYQAWQMTGSHELKIAGPYKVGAGPAAPAA
jgi:hypothetical protein